ncbi:MAG: hypothetical protein WCD89_01650 [Anaerocolumna sp.]
MKKNSKLLSLIIGTTMVISVLSGCGGSNSTGSADTSTTEETTKTNEATTQDVSQIRMQLMQRH